MIGLLGAKAIGALVGALALASVGAYFIHSLKASGANALAAKIGQEQLVVQAEQIKRQQADVQHLTGENATLRKTADGRQRALNIALSAIKHTEATEQCPENCKLSWSPPS